MAQMVNTHTTTTTLLSIVHYEFTPQVRRSWVRYTTIATKELTPRCTAQATGSPCTDRGTIQDWMAHAHAHAMIGDTIHERAHID